MNHHNRFQRRPLVSLSSSILVLLTTVTYTPEAKAQCSVPTAASIIPVASSCASNGSIIVTSTTGGSGNYKQYALYSADNTTEVKPYQNDSIINLVPSGNYTLRIRYVCSSSFSPVYTASVAVAGNYITPSISNAIVERHAKCGNGRISAQSINGTTPYTYALVSSLSQPEPVASYIRSPQTSNTFDHLPAGTYYLRVYDACNSYATTSLTVNNIASQTPNFLFQKTYTLCDTTLWGQLSISNINSIVLGTADTNFRKAWIVFPNGSTDTINMLSTYPPYNTLSSPYGGGSSAGIPIPFSKLGTVGGGSFPNNIGGTWPKYFTLGYKDACGNVHTRLDSLSKPTITYNIVINTSRDVCDSAGYQFRINTTPSSGTSSILLSLATTAPGK